MGTISRKIWKKLKFKLNSLDTNLKVNILKSELLMTIFLTSKLKEMIKSITSNSNWLQMLSLKKIESKFECNEEEDKQTLTIKVPKNVKIFQVPIAMEEQN